MTTKQWFFPIQEEIKKATEANKLERVGFCVRQEVGEDFYFEIWNCRNAEQNVIPYVFFYNKTEVKHPHLFIYKYISNFPIHY